MIPEPGPEAVPDCLSPEELRRRNCRNEAPPPPPPPAVGERDGLILPRRPANPCLESAGRKELHRELLFQHRLGRSVLNQKSELHRALQARRHQQQQQQQTQQSDLARALQERARRREQDRPEDDDDDRCVQGDAEFLRVRARMRANMEAK